MDLKAWHFWNKFLRINECVYEQCFYTNSMKKYLKNAAYISKVPKRWSWKKFNVFEKVKVSLLFLINSPENLLFMLCLKMIQVFFSLRLRMLKIRPFTWWWCWFKIVNNRILLTSQTRVHRDFIYIV